MKLNLHPKVAAGGTTGAVAAGIVWALKQFWGIDLDPAIAVLIATAAGTLAGYLIKSPKPAAVQLPSSTATGGTSGPKAGLR